MRIERKERLLILLCTIVIPAVLCSVIYPAKSKNQKPVSGTEEMMIFVETVPERVGFSIRLLEKDGTISSISLEEYVTGVVLKEMPSSFAYEALKAQAVAARTYTLRRCVYQGKHEAADVCTDPACCQAFVREDTYLQNGGTIESIALVQSAVEATTDLVMVYAGKLIESTYFSSSGGMTESAVAVWGSDVPYLQATESPGEESSAHFSESRFISGSELSSMLGIRTQDGHTVSVTELCYTEGKGIDTVKIGGKLFTGTELRKLLNLRSTAITITPTGSGITVTTRGYGHRVGMSQYGADAMARSGSDFKEILLYYYSGVSICTRLEAGIQDKL